ncbi:MAG: hypothetical protein ACRCX2_15545 [Paraclostridium sp.]
MTDLEYVEEKIKLIRDNFIVPKDKERRKVVALQMIEILSNKSCRNYGCGECPFTNNVGKRWRKLYGSCSRVMGINPRDYSGVNQAEVARVMIEWAKSGFKGKIKLPQIEFDF